MRRLTSHWRRKQFHPSRHPQPGPVSPPCRLPRYGTSNIYLQTNVVIQEPDYHGKSCFSWIIDSGTSWILAGRRLHCTSRDIPRRANSSQFGVGATMPIAEQAMAVRTLEMSMAWIFFGGGRVDRRTSPALAPFRPLWCEKKPKNEAWKS